MILIITHNYDQATSKICLWFNHFKQNYKIISSEDSIRMVYNNNKGFHLRNDTRGYDISLNRITKILYRQGDALLKPKIYGKPSNKLLDFIKKENKIFQDYFYYLLEKKEHLGHPQHSDLNKITVLEIAKQFRINIPDYIITTKKRDLVNFLKITPSLITKTVLPAFNFQDKQNNYYSYTERLTKTDIVSLGDNFYPTFFQKLIEKKYDIRSFYIKDKFYSIAIVSQSNQATKFDFRNYDHSYPNRQIPFILPKSITLKLIKLIKELNLSYCSIDLIYGQDNRFYFLEINPIGQFGNVSYFGNYYLEKAIAKEMI